jgi:aspartate aminotransferase
MVRLCGGEVKFIATKGADGFKIKATDLVRNLSQRSKLLILNSPSNPCGSLYTKQELEAIAGICTKHNLYVISDEIYEKIIFDGFSHISIGSINKEMFDLTITVNGVSKTYSMTGWRIGYIGAPLGIIKGVSKIQDHSSSNPNSIAQKAAIAAISSSGDFTASMCKEFQRRRDYIISRLDKMKRITYLKPQGAFYIFCNISKTKLNSREFSNRLLEEELVAVIPGIAFGLDDHVRVSFATSLSEIEKGMDRIEQWEKQL